jgi:hypothetical protein
MHVGVGPGPNGPHQHQSTHYVYEIQSGAVVGIHYFVGAATKSEEDRLKQILKSSSEASGIAEGQLAVLTNPDIEPGHGALRIDRANKRITRMRSDSDPHIRP